MAELVVLVGPVGAGKSTVAGRLAQLVRQGNLLAADVDMDDVAFMQCGGDDVEQFWRRAAIARAGLVRAWFDAGVDVVITHGAYVEANGFETLWRALPPDVEIHRILLRVNAEAAVARVHADQTRGISREPRFVRESNQRFQGLADALPVMHLEIDTTERDPDAIAAEVLEVLTTPRS